MEFTPTESQAKAIADIKDWYHNRKGQQQVYRLFGYAGTGKSTLVKHVVAELGLDNERRIHEYTKDERVVPDTLYGTYTGKAALVLRRKGVPCRTIHSLVYTVTEATAEEIAKAKVKLEELERDALGRTGHDRLIADAVAEQQRRHIRDLRKPQFRLNDDSDIKFCKLLVLDEVSMVGGRIARDVLSFGKPTLVLGDPGQLPPIYNGGDDGGGALTETEPDMMMTEIHRQAAESAVVRLATMAREGDFIPYGRHDEFVWKLSRNQVTPTQLLKADQVICGRNATRLMLNNAMRRAAGFADRLPQGPLDKVICLKNDHPLGLINGMFLEVDNIGDLDGDEVVFSATLVNDEGVQIGGVYGKDETPRNYPIYAGHFLDHEEYDKDRDERDWKKKKQLIEATFGYAITCHKAQGSQWRNVVVWDDHLGRTAEDRARWLYTAITRAEEGLVILD